MNKKFAFLTATRFWAMFVGAASIYLSAKGWIGEAERNFIASLMGGFLTVGSIDRAVDKISNIKNADTVIEIV